MTIERDDSVITVDMIKDQRMSEGQFVSSFSDITGDKPNQMILVITKRKLEELGQAGENKELPTYQQWADAYLVALTSLIK